MERWLAVEADGALLRNLRDEIREYHRRALDSRERAEAAKGDMPSKRALSGGVSCKAVKGNRQPPVRGQRAGDFALVTNRRRLDCSRRPLLAPPAKQSATRENQARQSSAGDRRDKRQNGLFALWCPAARVALSSSV
jgi:hypothetical protein